MVGEALATHLSQKGYNVTGIGRSDKKQVKTIILDLNSDWSDSILPESLDVIIHLAQSEKFREFPATASEVYNVNTNSTLKLLDYARKTGVKKFIYASSGGVYGTGDKPFDENSPIAPVNELGFYLSTKLMSEVLVKNYQGFFHTDILRFFFVYGPRQRKDMLIPRLIESVKNGTPIKLQGEEGIKINPVYVDDAIEAIENIMQLTGNNILNIGGKEVLSLKEICNTIGKHFGKVPVFENDLNSKPKNIIADIKYLQQVTGKESKSTFASTLKNFN